MNTQLATNVHTFTDGVVDILMEKFDDMKLGGEGDGAVTKEMIMQELFGDYKPNDSVDLAAPKKGKKKKKKSSGEKRALSGYTFFGKMSKEAINEEIKDIEEETGEKPKYVTISAKKWKALSEEEKAEWNLAAKGFGLFVKENPGSYVDEWTALKASEKKSWNKKANEPTTEEVEDEDEE